MARLAWLGLILPTIFVNLPLGNAEIIITELDLANDKIELVNIGPSNIDITNWALCNRVNGVPFYLPVNAGGATVDAGNSDPGAGLNLAPGLVLVLDIAPALLPDATGEFGIYNAQDFTNPDAIEDYILWGNINGERDIVAAAAGLWIDDDSIDVTGLGAGDSIQLKDGLFGNQASDYEIASANLGTAPNLPTLAPVTPSPVAPAPPPCTGIFAFLNICGACFSPYATVQVADGRGTIKMEDLKIGDTVLTADGTYSEVYSFGHYEPTVKTKYLQIQTNDKAEKPIEISSEHLLYVLDIPSNTNRIVPAGSIKVGDLLVGESGTPSPVVSIQEDQRAGAYSPLTTKGNLVVNGVVASSYVTRSWIDNQLVSGEMLHNLQHGAALPYRLYCAVTGGCNEETYHDDTGFSPYVMWFYNIEHWMLNLNNDVAQVAFLLVLSIPAMLAMLLGQFLTMMTTSRSIIVLMVHVLSFLLGWYLIKDKTMTVTDNNNKDMVKKTA